VDKREARRVARAARSVLSARERSAASEIICAQIISSARFASSSFVATFIPMPIEVDVWPITRAALAAGKRVAVPLIVGDGLMELTEVDASDLDALVPDAFGIGTPARHRVVPVGAVDLVVVPLTGVDSRGNRVGGGKGYYDRKLALESGAFRVGVAFDVQVVADFEPDPWDAPIGVVITERGPRVGADAWA
jgi:5-formyltetrahydrofolate cyclo-ligase